MSACKHRSDIRCNLFANDWAEARCRIKNEKDCPYFDPIFITNYDRLISKSPEELAEWIAREVTERGIAPEAEYKYWLNWLKDEVDGDE